MLIGLNSREIMDKCETEKGAFTKDIATLSHRLADANYTIHRLTQDNVSILFLYILEYLHFLMFFYLIFFCFIL